MLKLNYRQIHAGLARCVVLAIGRQFRLNAKQWELVASCLPMTLHVAQKKVHPLFVNEAVEEVGIDTLIRCAELWDENRGKKFSTYAYRALYNSYMVWNLKRNRRRDIERKCRYVPTKYEGVMAVDIHDYIQWLTSGLDEYQRTLLVLRFWAGMDIYEIGVRLDVPSRTVLRHLTWTLDELKEKTCFEQS